MKIKFQEFTDSQWQVIEKILNDQRKRKHSLRTIINAIFSINNTGVQWRNLDSKYPPWETVFYRSGEPSFYSIKSTRCLERNP